MGIFMEEIVKLIRTLSISGKLKGMRYLTSAVEIAARDENTLFSVMTAIYPVVAEQYQTTAACVERNIRTVITSCWERGGKERLCDIAGYSLTEKPTVSEMIDLLADYVRKNRTA